MTSIFRLAFLSLGLAGSLLQAVAYPSLYSGCAIPSRGYERHGSPRVDESISFILKDEDYTPVTHFEPGGAYSLTIIVQDSTRAWISVEICTTSSAGSGSAAVQQAEGSSTGKDGLRSTHANIMLLAWGILIPGAVTHSIRKDSSWIKWHRAFAIFGVIVASLGFAVAVIGLHSDVASNAGRDSHRNLGYFAMLLGILQPINAQFCGKPPSTSGEGRPAGRVAWEVWHKGAGYSGVVAAFITMWMGLHLGYSPIEGRKNMYLVVYFAIAAVVVVACVRALVQGWRVGAPQPQPDGSYVVVTELAPIEVEGDTNALKPQSLNV